MYEIRNSVKKLLNYVTIYRSMQKHQHGNGQVFSGPAEMYSCYYVQI